MRKFIVGHKGYVGSELLRRGFHALECDISDYDSVESALKQSRPDLVIHLAGKSDVDFCERKENQDVVIKSNVRGSYFLFQNLQTMRIPGVLLSTDQVWRGRLFEKHKENSKRTPPVNFYGMSKVSAEAVALDFGMNVVRTSYLFDYERIRRQIQFVRAGISTDYPVFIKRSFLYLRDFGELLESYCQRLNNVPRVLHLSGSSVVSWYGFMREIERQYGLRGSVKPRFFEKKGFAPRPWFGGLDVSKSLDLGFPNRDYVGGIMRMRDEN